MAEWICRVSDNYSQSVLSQSEMETNALNIMAILNKQMGWSLEAVAGALGNMQRESTLNPGACEGGRGVPAQNALYYGGGLGLIQWTDYPAYQREHVHPILWSARHFNQNWWDGTFQCTLLGYANDATITSCGEGVGALWGWLESNSYPSISFPDYKNFTGSVDDATEYWYFCMEMHSTYEDAMELRKQYANYWYSFLQGEDPPIPTPSPTPSIYKKMPLWMKTLRPHYRR